MNAEVAVAKKPAMVLKAMSMKGKSLIVGKKLMAKGKPMMKMGKAKAKAFPKDRPSLMEGLAPAVRGPILPPHRASSSRGSSMDSLTSVKETPLLVSPQDKPLSMQQGDFLERYSLPGSTLSSTEEALLNVPPTTIPPLLLGQQSHEAEGALGVTSKAELPTSPHIVLSPPGDDSQAIPISPSTENSTVTQAPMEKASELALCKVELDSLGATQQPSSEHEELPDPTIHDAEQGAVSQVVSSEMATSQVITELSSDVKVVSESNQADSLHLLQREPSAETTQVLAENDEAKKALLPTVADTAAIVEDTDMPLEVSERARLDAAHTPAVTEPEEREARDEAAQNAAIEISTEGTATPFVVAEPVTVDTATSLSAEASIGAAFALADPLTEDKGVAVAAEKATAAEPDAEAAAVVAFTADASVERMSLLLAAEHVVEDTTMVTAASEGTGTESLIPLLLVKPDLQDPALPTAAATSDLDPLAKPAVVAEPTAGREAIPVLLAEASAEDSQIDTEVEKSGLWDVVDPALPLEGLVDVHGDPAVSAVASELPLDGSAVVAETAEVMHVETATLVEASDLKRTSLPAIQTEALSQYGESAREELVISQPDTERSSSITMHAATETPQEDVALPEVVPVGLTETDVSAGMEPAIEARDMAATLDPLPTVSDGDESKMILAESSPREELLLVEVATPSVEDVLGVDGTHDDVESDKTSVSSETLEADTAAIVTEAIVATQDVSAAMSHSASASSASLSKIVSADKLLDVIVSAPTMEYLEPSPADDSIAVGSSETEKHKSIHGGEEALQRDVELIVETMLETGTMNVGETIMRKECLQEASISSVDSGAEALAQAPENLVSGGRGIPGEQSVGTMVYTIGSKDVNDGIVTTGAESLSDDESCEQLNAEAEEHVALMLANETVKEMDIIEELHDRVDRIRASSGSSEGSWSFGHTRRLSGDVKQGTAFDFDSLVTRYQPPRRSSVTRSEGAIIQPMPTFTDSDDKKPHRDDGSLSPLTDAQPTSEATFSADDGRVRRGAHRQDHSDMTAESESGEYSAEVYTPMDVDVRKKVEQVTHEAAQHSTSDGLVGNQILDALLSGLPASSRRGDDDGAESKHKRLFDVPGRDDFAKIAQELDDSSAEDSPDDEDSTRDTSIAVVINLSHASAAAAQNLEKMAVVRSTADAFSSLGLQLQKLNSDYGVGLPGEQLEEEEAIEEVVDGELAEDEIESSEVYLVRAASSHRPLVRQTPASLLIPSSGNTPIGTPLIAAADGRVRRAMDTEQQVNVIEPFVMKTLRERAPSIRDIYSIMQEQTPPVMQMPCVEQPAFDLQPAPIRPTQPIELIESANLELASYPRARMISQQLSRAAPQTPLTLGVPEAAATFPVSEASTYMLERVQVPMEMPSFAACPSAPNDPASISVSLTDARQYIEWQEAAKYPETPVASEGFADKPMYAQSQAAPKDFLPTKGDRQQSFATRQIVQPQAQPRANEASEVHVERSMYVAPQATVTAQSPSSEGLQQSFAAHSYMELPEIPRVGAAGQATAERPMYIAASVSVPDLSPKSEGRQQSLAPHQYTTWQGLPQTVVVSNVSSERAPYTTASAGLTGIAHSSGVPAESAQLAYMGPQGQAHSTTPHDRPFYVAPSHTVTRSVPYIEERAAGQHHMEGAFIGQGRMPTGVRTSPLFTPTARTDSPASPSRVAAYPSLPPLDSRSYRVETRTPDMHSASNRAFTPVLSPSSAHPVASYSPPGTSSQRPSHMTSGQRATPVTGERTPEMISHKLEKSTHQSAGPMRSAVLSEGRSFTPVMQPAGVTRSPLLQPQVPSTQGTRSGRLLESHDYAARFDNKGRPPPEHGSFAHMPLKALDHTMGMRTDEALEVESQGFSGSLSNQGRREPDFSFSQPVGRTTSKQWARTATHESQARNNHYDLPVLPSVPLAELEAGRRALTHRVFSRQEGSPDVRPEHKRARPLPSPLRPDQQVMARQSVRSLSDRGVRSPAVTTQYGSPWADSMAIRAHAQQDPTWLTSQSNTRNARRSPFIQSADRGARTSVGDGRPTRKHWPQSSLTSSPQTPTPAQTVGKPLLPSITLKPVQTFATPMHQAGMTPPLLHSHSTSAADWRSTPMTSHEPDPSRYQPSSVTPQREPMVISQMYQQSPAMSQKHDEMHELRQLNYQGSTMPTHKPSSMNEGKQMNAQASVLTQVHQPGLQAPALLQQHQQMGVAYRGQQSQLQTSPLTQHADQMPISSQSQRMDHRGSNITQPHESMQISNSLQEASKQGFTTHLHHEYRPQYQSSSCMKLREAPPCPLEVQEANHHASALVHKQEETLGARRLQPQLPSYGEQHEQKYMTQQSRDSAVAWRYEQAAMAPRPDAHGRQPMPSNHAPLPAVQQQLSSWMPCHPSERMSSSRPFVPSSQSAPHSQYSAMNVHDVVQTAAPAMPRKSWAEGYTQSRPTRSETAPATHTSAQSRVTGKRQHVPQLPGVSEMWAIQNKTGDNTHSLMGSADGVSERQPLRSAPSGMSRPSHFRSQPLQSGTAVSVATDRSTSCRAARVEQGVDSPQPGPLGDSSTSRFSETERLQNSRPGATESMEVVAQEATWEEVVSSRSKRRPSLTESLSTQQLIEAAVSSRGPTSRTSDKVIARYKPVEQVAQATQSAQEDASAMQATQNIPVSETPQEAPAATQEAQKTSATAQPVQHKESAEQQTSTATNVQLQASTVSQITQPAASSKPGMQSGQSMHAVQTMQASHLVQSVQRPSFVKATPLDMAVDPAACRTVVTSDVCSTFLPREASHTSFVGATTQAATSGITQTITSRATTSGASQPATSGKRTYTCPSGMAPSGTTARSLAFALSSQEAEQNVRGVSNVSHQTGKSRTVSMARDASSSSRQLRAGAAAKRTRSVPGVSPSKAGRSHFQRICMCI